MATTALTLRPQENFNLAVFNLAVFNLAIKGQIRQIAAYTLSYAPNDVSGGGGAETLKVPVQGKPRLTY